MLFRHRVVSGDCKPLTLVDSNYRQWMFSLHHYQCWSLNIIEKTSDIYVVTEAECPPCGQIYLLLALFGSRFVIWTFMKFGEADCEPSWAGQWWQGGSVHHWSGQGANTANIYQDNSIDNNSRPAQSLSLSLPIMSSQGSRLKPHNSKQRWVNE